jgi:hypothetical protein
MRGSERTLALIVAALSSLIALALFATEELWFGMLMSASLAAASCLAGSICLEKVRLSDGSPGLAISILALPMIVSAPLLPIPAYFLVPLGGLLILAGGIRSSIAERHLAH